MIRKGKNTIRDTQPEFYTGRRRLLALVASVIVLDAVSNIKIANAAVKNLSKHSRDSVTDVNPVGSISLDTRAPLFTTSEGLPGHLQNTTPTPDATIIAAQKDKIIQDDLAMP